MPVYKFMGLNVEVENSLPLLTETPEKPQILFAEVQTHEGFQKLAKAEMESLLLNDLLPNIVAKVCPPVLHAAAIQAKSGCVAVAGLSGAGKSTLSAHAEASGMTTLSDDFLRLELTEQDVLVWPGPPMLRHRDPLPLPQLYPRPLYGKWHLKLNPNLEEAPLPLKAIFILQSDRRQHWHKEPIQLAQVPYAIAPHINSKNANSEQLKRIFSAIMALTEKVPAFNLYAPTQPTGKLEPDSDLPAMLVW